MDINFKEFWEITITWLTTSGLRVALIIILALIATKIAAMVSNRIFKPFTKIQNGPEIEKRARTLSSLIRYILHISILGVSVVMVLGEFGIDIGPIIAAAGVVGLAIGFGAQHLVQDIISGFFILMDDQIRVGDVVNIGGQGGLVERVNLRMTVLRDLSGSVHFIRNGQINIVTNMTKDFSYYVLEIGIAYRENVDDVIEVVKKIDEELRADSEYGSQILEPIEILGLDKFADSAIIIKARIKTVPIKQWWVGREFNRRMKIKFDELGIEIPFPHVTLYAGQDKDGKAAAFHLLNQTEKDK